jgi:hypothetical protein
VRFIRADFEGKDLETVRIANKWSEDTFQVGRDALEEAKKLWKSRHEKRLRLKTQLERDLPRILERSLLVGADQWSSSGVRGSGAGDAVFVARENPAWLLLRRELGPAIDDLIDEHVAAVRELRRATDQVRHRFTSSLLRNTRFARIRSRSDSLREALFAALVNRVEMPVDPGKIPEILVDLEVERFGPSYLVSIGAWRYEVTSDMGIEDLRQAIREESGKAVRGIFGTAELREFVDGREAVRETSNRIMKELASP